MIKLSDFFKIIIGHGFSFKLPLRFIALLVILFFTLAMGVITYRGGVEIWGFFKIGHIAQTLPGKFISQMMGWTMGAATFVQSGPIIWDKLSYWGQEIDNKIMKWIFRRTYFLDEVEYLLKETRKLINMMNSELLKVSKEKMYSKELRHENVNKEFKLALKKAYDYFEKIITLLKKYDSYDNINQQRKSRADEELNNLIVRLTETFQKSIAIYDYKNN